MWKQQPLLTLKIGQNAPMYINAYLEYSEQLKDMMFSRPLEELEKIYLDEESKAPKSLTSQFANKLTRENVLKQVETT